MDIGGKKKKVNKLIEKGMHEVANMALNIKYLKKNFSLLKAFVCRCSSKWVILKYATTHNYPQPPEKPPTIHNHPQPSSTTQKTTHDHPKVTQKGQNVSHLVKLIVCFCQH